MAILFAAGRFKATDKANAPISGAFLQFYATLTSTAQPIYADSALATVLTNPVKADANGLFPEIWLDDSLPAYKVIFTYPDVNDTTQPGSIIWTIQQYNSTFDASAFVDTLLPFIYRETRAEISAGVTPTNYAYAPGDLRRYGAKIDGATDDTTSINNAIKVAQASGAVGYVLHPGGNCVHASQILFGNGVRVVGNDREACIFTYTGLASSSAWRYTNNGTSNPAINTSGFGRVSMEGVTITTAVSVTGGAALELNACGYALFTIKNCHFGGSFKWGIIGDGIEVAHIYDNIIDNGGGISGSAGVWLTNGADRTVGQSLGFTNRVTINDNHFNAAGICVVDDGGSDHSIVHNNLNGASIAVLMCGLLGFLVDENEIENAGVVIGSANIYLTNTTAYGGVNVGPCQAGRIEGNFFGADMAAASSALNFQGAAMHQGITVKDNWFRNNLGRSADINVTKLSNSFCGQNYASATTNQHYTGTHNDADGNILWPPQNGYTGGFNEGAYLWGDSRYRHQFVTAIRQKKIVLTYSASITPDCRQGNLFQITATNGTAFTINAPTGDPVNGDDGTIITIQIKNTSGGALGAITFGAGYKLAGAFTAPATGNNRSITFYDDNVTGVWYEISRTGADTPN